MLSKHLLALTTWLVCNTTNVLTAEFPAPKGSGYAVCRVVGSGRSWECFTADQVYGTVSRIDFDDGSDHDSGVSRPTCCPDLRSAVDEQAENFARYRANPYNTEVISNLKQAYLAYTVDHLKRNLPLDPTIRRNDAPLEPYWEKALTAYSAQARAIESDWSAICERVRDPRTSSTTLEQINSLLRVAPGETRK